MNDRHVTPSFPLRMQADLRGSLEVSASKNKRSLNSEITARLESTFHLDEQMAEMRAGGHAEVGDMIDSVIAENTRFQGGEQKLTDLLKAEIGAVLDHKISLLEQRLLAAIEAKI